MLHAPVPGKPPCKDNGTSKQESLPCRHRLLRVMGSSRICGAIGRGLVCSEGMAGVQVV